MSDDLVKRLRDAAKSGYDIYGLHCDIELEAADRIEKLEAAEIARPPLAVLPAATADAPLGVIVYCGLPGDGGGAVSPGAPAGGQAKGNDGLEASLRRNAERWKAAATRYGVAVVLPSTRSATRMSKRGLKGGEQAPPRPPLERRCSPPAAAAGAAGRLGPVRAPPGAEVT